MCGWRAAACSRMPQRSPRHFQVAGPRLNRGHPSNPHRCRGHLIVSTQCCIRVVVSLPGVAWIVCVWVGHSLMVALTIRRVYIPITVLLLTTLLYTYFCLKCMLPIPDLYGWVLLATSHLHTKVLVCLLPHTVVVSCLPLAGLPCCCLRCRKSLSPRHSVAPLRRGLNGSVSFPAGHPASSLVLVHQRTSWWPHRVGVCLYHPSIPAQPANLCGA